MPEDIGTQKWIDASNVALARLQHQPDETTRLEIAVELKSDAGSSYFSLVIDNNGARLEPGSVPGSQVGIVIDRQLAAAINQGTISVAEAIENDGIKIKGNAGNFINSVDILSRLAKSLSTILA